MTMLAFKLPFTLVGFGMVVLLWQRFVQDWDWQFHLAIGDELFVTYRIAHRIGGLFVVCGCSILVCGYLGMSCVIRSCAISEALFICLGDGTASLFEAVVMTMEIRPGF